MAFQGGTKHVPFKSQVTNPHVSNVSWADLENTRQNVCSRNSIIVCVIMSSFYQVKSDESAFSGSADNI